jgi:hypothetical protein
MTPPPSVVRFDVAEAPEKTPPFILWTLAHACSLRELSDIEDPAGTERLLRSARCVSDARSLGHVHGDVVVARNATVQRPLGFSIQSALEPHGGLEFIESQCANCPANAIESIEPQALAGCVGYLVPPEDLEFYAFVSQQFPSTPDTNRTSVHSHTAWHQLWLKRQVNGEMLECHETIMQALAEHECYQQLPGLFDYLAALNIARKTAQQLIVQSFPAGTCEGRRWFIPAHCGNCTAAWPDTRRTTCVVCSHQGGRQESRTRRRMGIRPYRLLSEFLNDAAINKLDLPNSHINTR